MVRVNMADRSSTQAPCSPSKDRKPVTSLEETQAGMVVEAQDKFGKWFMAKIVTIDEEEKEILIHFMGWSSRFDEWIELSEDRVCKPSQQSLEEHVRRQRGKKNLRVGDRVRAKWKDNKFYSGQLISIDNFEGSAKVLFDDDKEAFTTPMSTLRKVKPEGVVSHSKTAPLENHKASSTKAGAMARSERAEKRRRSDQSTSSHDRTATSISPPSSPVTPSRRKKRTRYQVSDDDWSATESYTEESSEAEVVNSMSCDDYSPSRDSQQIDSSISWSRGRRRRSRRRLSSPVGSSDGGASSGTQHYKLRTRIPTDPPCTSSVADHNLVSDQRSLRTGQTCSTHLTASSPSLSTIAATASLLTPSPQLDPPGDSVRVPVLSELSEQPGLTITEPTPPETPELNNKTLDSVLVPSLAEGSPPSDPAVTTIQGKRCTPDSSRGEKVVRKKRWKAPVTMSTRAQQRLGKHVIKSSKDRPGHLAPKEMVVVLDHNEHKCNFTGCTKSFRKESLLLSHLKHYHNYIPKQPVSSKPAAAISGKTKLQSCKVVVKPSPRQPGSAGEGQEKRGNKSTEVTKDSKAPPTSPTKQEKPVSGASSSSPSKTKGVDKTSASPRKGTNKTTESHSGGVKGSPSKRTKLSFGQKPAVTKPLDSATPRKVVSLSVPAAENGQSLYKGIPGYSSVAIMKIVSRQRKKLQTWPPIVESEEEEESDYDLSDEEDDEDWEEFCGGRKKDGGNRDDVVHCVCGSELDEGFMIQCEQCLCWQHGDCIGVSQSNPPDKYICPICSNPPGMRQRSRYKFSRAWFNEGSLPSVPGGPALSGEERAAMIQCHQLSADLHRMKKMAHCCKIKLQAVSSKSHPYLKQWSRRCTHLTMAQVKDYLTQTLSPISNQLETLLVSNDNQPALLQGLPRRAPPSQSTAAIANGISSTSSEPISPISPVLENTTSSSTQTSSVQDQPKTTSSVSAIPVASLSSTIVTRPTVVCEPVLAQPQSLPSKSPPPSSVVDATDNSALSATASVPSPSGPGESCLMQLFMEKLTASLQHAEPGNWLHRLLLLNHIECVHKKMLNWIEDVDRKIDAIPMESGSSLLSDWESVLLEVQGTIADLEKMKDSSSVKKHITLNV